MRSSLTTIAIAVLLNVQAAAAIAKADDPLAALVASAEQGDARAQTELAVKYEHAEGVARDFHKANQLYCRAAKQGYAEAQFKMAWVYANGRGVSRDDQLAGTLMAMAAEQGHAHAAKLLPYLPVRKDVQLPSCLLPDPLVVVVGTMPVPEEPVIVAKDRTEIEKLVYHLAPQFSVDSKLVLAVISVESAFNPTAVSPKKAQGLMQLIPETAERFGVKHVFNPEQNIKGGMAYLRWLLALFEGDVSLVLAAYNAGERAVEKYRGIPPYAETQQYVRKITGIYKKALHPYERGIVDPSPMLSRLKSVGR